MRIARNLALFAISAAVVAAAYSYAHSPAGLAQEADNPVAPELSGAVAWLNTDHPISVKELAGRVVILDFWTYGCINCMHVLPVLRQLEARRAGQPLEVIGVHSAKFDNEKAPERVRAAVERYGITHPVAVDSNMAIWDHYGVNAWPTLVVIRPDGRVAGQLPGEVSLEPLDKLVGQLMDEGRKQGVLAKGPALPHRAPPLDTGELAYPGKVLAGPDGRLFLADSRHHRVLITASDGRLLDQIGSGTQGRKDGSFEAAQLDDPQGMALDGHTLYLADARGYAVLAIDLQQRSVAALAGTGKLGQEPLGRPVPAASAALRSPWDVALDGKRLLVAMAGTHQIAVVDLSAGASQATIGRFAGSGREAIEDGSANEASFAQPSGLSILGRTLYVADSESSGVRAVDLDTRLTRTLLGTGLFDWGDGEGPLGPKLIQHPLAVAASAGGLWVADSYNGKIKRFDPGQRSLATVVSEAGGKKLSDPGGLWVEADGSLLIADTGNDRLLRLPPGASVPLVVPVGKRAAAPQLVTAAALGAEGGPGEQLPVGSVQLPTQTLPLGEQRLRIALVAPTGFAFSEGAPYSLALTAVGGHVKAASPSLSGEAKAGGRVELEGALEVAAGTGELSVAVHANLCDAVNHAACFPVRTHFTVPVVGSASGGTAQGPLTLALAVPPGAKAALGR